MGMSISAHYWVIAFVFALALHALAGGAILLARNAAPPPNHTPRGVMVSLNALSVGNSTEVNSETAEPVKPVNATTPKPVAAMTPQPTAPAADSVAPTAVAATSPTPVVPVPASDIPATTDGAQASDGGVDIPVAKAVTIQAADTLQALEQTLPEPVPATNAGQINTGSGTKGRSNDPTTTYINRITSWLGNHKYYPQAARSRGAEGTVRLHIVIGRDGSVINVGIARSSGNPALDQAAMDMVKRSEPLPAMTETMLRTRLEIILPVNYTLGNQP